MTQRGNKIVGLALGGVVLALAASTLPGETQLVLVDGRILGGTNVRRDGDEYVLLLDNGQEVTIPVPLVETVRLEGDDRRKERRRSRATSRSRFAWARSRTVNACRRRPTT